MPPKKPCRNCGKLGHNMMNCTEATQASDKKVAAPSKQAPSTTATGKAQPGPSVTSGTVSVQEHTSSNVLAPASSSSRPSSSSGASIQLPIRSGGAQPPASQPNPPPAGSQPSKPPVQEQRQQYSTTASASKPVEKTPRIISKPPANFKQYFTEKYSSIKPNTWKPDDVVQAQLNVAEEKLSDKDQKTIITKGNQAQDRWERGLRTDFGTSGRRILVVVNYVAVHKNPESLYQYQIKVTHTWLPDQDLSAVEDHRLPKKEKRQILEGLAADARLASHAGKFAMEDHENLWSTEKLFNHTSAYPEQNYNNVSYRKGNGVMKLANVDLRFFRQIAVSRMIQSDVPIPSSSNALGPIANAAPLNQNATTPAVVESDETAPQTESESALTIRGLNALVASYASSQPGNIQQGLNKFFVTANWQSVNECLHTLVGFFSSARPGMIPGQVLLNLNTATKVFIQPMLVSDFMRIFQHVFPGRDTDALKGLKVRITYNRPAREGMDPNLENNRIKIVASIGQVKTNQQTFPVASKAPMLVRDYMKDLKIFEDESWTRFPCVNVGRNDPTNPETAVWIPPNLLEILPNQALKSGLTKHFADRIVSIACRKPDENLNLIAGMGLETMGINPPQPRLDAFGLKIGTALLKIPARFLVIPIIRLNTVPDRSGKTNPRDAEVMRASWMLKDLSFTKPVKLVKWGLMNLDPRATRSSRDFGTNLQKQLIALGLGAGPAIFDDVFDYPQDWPGFQTRLVKSYNTVLKDCQVVVVLLPDRESHPYLRVVADIRVGKPTVCSIKGSRKDGLSSQYCANVAMKVNAKLAGRSHNVINRDQTAAFDGTDIMVVGADVSHPSPGSGDDAQSFAGVVASVDREAYTYLASMRPQDKGLEKIDALDKMIKERLSAHAKQNAGKLPSKILFYRDGVSESQYPMVRASEIPAVHRGYADAVKTFGRDKGQKLELTFVVVGKRHHTRFFPAAPGDRDGGGNVLPGLVVDQVVTSSANMDFYLQSHAAIKGTARSSHYYVLCNEMKLTSDRLQSLTLNLCFNFARATKGISICAPARYADLLCDRARAYAGTGYTIPADGVPWPPVIQNHMFYV